MAFRCLSGDLSARTCGPASRLGSSRVIVLRFGTNLTLVIR
jgi:hypothetical protein